MENSNAQRLQKLHAELLAEFNNIQQALRDERMQCLQDRRFCLIAGAQWEGPLGDQFENKPRFEFNKCYLAVKRIYSEYRNNRITVDFQPKDGRKDDTLADACDGLYRSDYETCSGDEAVDNAFDEGTTGGVGAWRLRACYEDEHDDENDKQRIVFEPIFDADTCVFWNLGAKRYDKKDGLRCFVLTPYPRQAYVEDEAFDDDPTSWPQGLTQSYFDWCSPDIIWVAEVYRVEQKSEMVHFYRGLLDDEPDMRVTDTELEANPRMLEELQATGFREVRKKCIETRIVKKYTMSGGKIFDKGEHKPQVIPGTEIPVIPFYGQRAVVDGVERVMGAVRLAKDAQRLTNMLLSWLAEMAARFDIEKPIFSPEQVAGHSTMWAEDSIKKYPFLLANLLKDADGNLIPGSNVPMAYTKAPNVPPVMAALTQIATTALEDMLGNQQAGEQMQPQVSGRAVELIQNRLDMQSYIYVSNLAKSKKREGEVWLSMMKGIAVEEGRQMKVVDANGEAGSVVINQPMHDADTGEDYLDNDMTAASYDVAVTVGPSSSSQRSSTVRALTGMMQLTQDQDTQDVLGSLAMMNMEGEGINDARQFFRRKLVRKGVVKPTEEEVAELQQEAANQPPDPNAQLLQAAAEEAQANASKARAQVVETLTSADLKRAQTAKTYAETMGAHNDQLIASYQTLQQAFQPPQPRAA